MQTVLTVPGNSRQKNNNNKMFPEGGKHQNYYYFLSLLFVILVSPKKCDWDKSWRDIKTELSNTINSPWNVQRYFQGSTHINSDTDALLLKKLNWWVKFPGQTSWKTQEAVMHEFKNYAQVLQDISRGSGCGSQLKLWLGFLMTDRGEARRRSIVSRSAAS